MVKNKFYKVGVMPGKFLPLHRGHIHAILTAATKCETLYVVVGQNHEEVVELTKHTKFMSLNERVKWVAQEFSNMSHIKVLGIDEDEYDIPRFPNGWEKWAKVLQEIVPEPIDVIFGNEESYRENHKKYMPYIEYETFDVDRSIFNTSGTEIRENPIKHWDMLSGAARPFFAKKILITGTESCGKTTITKALAKTFYTSWSEEVGRYYSERYLGGREDAFTVEDFDRIAWLQYEQDREALRTANKMVFFDTDALITDFYCAQYLGIHSRFLTEFAKRQEYDLIIVMKPDVKWVADGQRWISEQKTREINHEIICDMYRKHKPHTPLIEVGGNYTERLNTIYNALQCWR